VLPLNLLWSLRKSKAGEADFNHRDSTRIVAVIILVVSMVSVLYTSRNSLLYPVSSARARPFTAALIDEVSAFIPDPAFINQTTSLLTSAGYKVDYYPPSSVTIDLLKRLPSMEYGIVVLRNHSTGFQGDVISLVTSEPYTQDEYAFEQLTDQIVPVELGVANATYFGITPLFVRDSMQGFFQDSIIVMMGCTGLTNSEMSQAFVSRGAQVYVSWDQVVQAYRTDVSTTIFWQWMTSGHSVRDSTLAATRDGPADPVYKSHLVFYPANEGSMTLAVATST